ncbi:MAG: glycosyltransferase [Microbacterium sp.]
MELEIVCEWIEATGGAEKVLDAMIEAFPGSVVHTLWNDAPERTRPTQVRESWMANTPLRRAKALALPLMDPTWRTRRTAGSPSRVLVSSYVFAHHVRFVNLPDVPKYVYVHSPARYIWTPEFDSRGRSPLVRMSAPYWRNLDRRRAAEAHELAANSEFVRQRIQMAWHRDATVIHPPVDSGAIVEIVDWNDAVEGPDARRLATLPADFVLGASRLVGYKRLDAVIGFAKSVGLPAVIVGVGPDRQRLDHLAEDAGVPVHFLGALGSPALYALYQRAAAFVFPPVEDFGIMPVEAMAAGGRVIVNRVGGTAETVVDGLTGVHAVDFEGAGARAALEAAARIDVGAARERAFAYDKSRYVSRLRGWMADDLSTAG